MKKIVFVCLGNICRSPIAHGIAQTIVERYNLDISVDSCGTSDYHKGQSPCQKSITIASKYGVDISNQKSRPVTRADNEVDYLVAMDDKNVADLKSYGFSNIIKLGDYALSGADIDDPYYYPDLEGFEKIFKDINIALEEFFAKEFDI